MAVEKTFNTTPLHEALGNLIPAHMVDDRRFFDSYYEAWIRVVDDYLLELQFVNAAKAVSTVLPWLTKTLWPVDVEWGSTGARHRHRTATFDASGVTSIYTGETYDLEALDIFLRGMQLDDPGKSTDYVASNTPDAAQLLGTEPRGTRIDFDAPPPADSQLDLMADRVLESTILTGTDVVTVPGGAGRDLLAAQVFVEALDITDDVTLTTSGGSTTIRWAEGRLFLAGSVIRVIDDIGATVQEVPIGTNTALLTVTAVDATSRVELVINVPIDAFSLDGNRVRVAGTNVPPDISVVVRDSDGQEEATPSANRSYFPLSREYDVETVEILFVGVDVLVPFVVDSTELRFTRPFDPNVRARIEVPIEQEHRHVHQRYTRTTVGSTVPLPDASESFVFSGLTQDPAYPVQVYVNDALLHADEYTVDTPASLTTTDVFPVGTVFDIYYVRDVDPIQHRHRRQRYTTIASEQVFAIGHTQDAQAFRVVFDGVNIASADPVIDVSSDRMQVVSKSVAPQGTIVRTRTTEFRRDYEHTLTGNDALIVSADSLQDGIAPFEEDFVPGGYQTQLTFGVGFDIVDGVMSSDVLLDETWLVMARFNLETGWDNFGRLVDFRRDNTVDYLNRLQAILGTYTSARTEYALENAADILLGSQINLQAGIFDGVATNSDGDRVMRVRRPDGTVAEVILHPTIPDRVRQELPRDHAVSEYAKFVDLPDVSVLPELARDLSDDYRPGKIMDRFEAGEVARTFSPALPVDTDALCFEDFGIDFLAQQVQVGDRVVIDFGGGADPFVSTILAVTKNKVCFSDTPVATLSEYSAGGYGSGGYGGVTFPSTLDGYTIFVRRRRRHDDIFFLDELSAAERDEAVDGLSKILSAFFSVLEIRWEAMTEEGQRDLGVFLDNAAPVYGRIQPIAKTSPALPLSDTIQASVVDAVTLEDSADYFYVGATTIAADPTAVGVSNGFIE